MRVLPDEVELELRPRFPLFGGWRTHYVIGYTVPVYEYLYRSGECWAERIPIPAAAVWPRSIPSVTDRR